MREILRPTWLEIDLAQVAKNVRRLRALLSPGTRLMAVVKADGYGHGAPRVAGAALLGGADCLGVATVEEGIALREAGIGAEILVLGATSERAAEPAVAADLSLALPGEEALSWLSAAAVRLERPARVHLKADTGMGRIGVRDAAALQALYQAAVGAPGILPVGAFTHFAAADAEDDAYVLLQHERFLGMLGALGAARGDLCVHAANSAAALRYPWTHHGMVRAGIALYVPPRLPDAQAAAGLGQAMRWVTRGAFLKWIEPGECVSYGCAFRAGRRTRVMTLPVGYADGYHRAIGGTGVALVRGRRAPVIGRVCMDQAMLDVTDIPEAALGDEVVLLGTQGDAHIPAAEMGRWCGMIDYEALLSPTARVPRTYRP